MRVIGLDVHRTFGEIVYLENGQCRSGGKYVLPFMSWLSLGKGLRADDEVVLEATGNPRRLCTHSVHTSLK